MKTAIKTIGFIGLTILLIFVLTKNKEIRQLKIQEQEQSEFLDTLQIEIDSLKFEIKNLLNKLDSIPKPIPVKATMYHPVEAQCDDTPLITADGSRICPINVSDWNWIAVSQDLLKKNGGIFEYGDQVYVKGTHKDGIYTIHDCMNKRKRNQIDILESIGTSQYKYDEIEIFALNDLDS
jgi:3D (Asp-Asp-Asp) domain-containing protein|tara:strand:+ start:100 stop:636 length:537 start_codon:yes stop_codon:yes gene_type:complete